VRRVTIENSVNAAIIVSGRALVEQCTISGSAGRGVDANSGWITNCTFADIAGELIFGGTRSSRLSVQNSLVDVSSTDGVRRRFIDKGGNLITRVIGGGWHEDTLRGSVDVPLDPRLGELAFNGGFVRTRAILPDSPAFEIGVETELEFDQRGEGFFRVVGEVPDAGAYEVQMGAEDIELVPGETIYDEETGLFEQWLTLRNDSPWHQPQVRLVVSNLPEGVSLYNGSGEEVLDVTAPLGKGAWLWIHLQYHGGEEGDVVSPLIEWMPKRLVFSALTDAERESVQIRRVGTDVELMGKVQLWREYQMEYSDDLQNWVPLGPSKLAQSHITQWVDRDEAPARRYYRIMEQK